MKKLGEDTVKHCVGLPLAIIILGGILATKYPSLTEWLKVSANVKSYMMNDKEDYEIPADRLIQLWVAEGIVSSKQEKMKVEKLANKLTSFLEENKSLVILDDIWNTEAWESLKPAFSARRTRSKCLLRVLQ
ncbi:hypothetical protein Goklo_021571, partial [Gossypium klotzschianum]|nr:hypothetical protein [Gossypium klotzschianum]